MNKKHLERLILGFVALCTVFTLLIVNASEAGQGEPLVSADTTSTTQATTTTESTTTTTVAPATTTTVPVTTTVAVTTPPLPLAPECSTFASQDEANAWIAANGDSHDTSNIDTNGDGVPCTRSFAPPAPEPAQTASAPPASPSGRCAIPDYICQRESGFDPYAVNSTGCSGRGCYGKYQFDPITWDNVARQMGRGDLVGNYLPSEADQDAVAAYLWAGGAGCSHWAAC